MNKLYYVIVICLFSGCHYSNHTDYSIIFSDKDWSKILVPITILSDLQEGNIFYKYENLEMNSFIDSLYEYCDTMLNYQKNRTIQEYICNRKNTTITNNLDTIFNGKIHLIKDTISNKNQYIILSEPFAINDSLVCLASTIIKPKEKFKNKHIWFLKKIDSSWEVIFLYNNNRRRFFMRSENI
jgi:hypothetical protein